MNPSELTILLATLRLGGIRAAASADEILDTPANLRPVKFAQALSSGKTAEMTGLIAHVSGILSRLAKDRN